MVISQKPGTVGVLGYKPRRAYIVQRYGFYLVWLSALTFTLAAWAIVRLVLEPSYLSLERQEVKGVVGRGQRLLEQNLEALGTSTQDYAWWDEAYRFGQGQKPNFVGVNFTAATLQNLHVEVMAYFDRAGSLLHAGQILPGATRLSPPNHTTLEALSHHRPKGKSSLAGFLEISGQVYLLVSSPVLPGDPSGPSPGFLVMARRIDANLIHSLSQALGSSLSLEPSTSDPRAIQVLGPNAIVGALPLTDLDNHIVATLKVQMTRPVYAQMRRTTAAFMVGIFLLALLSAGLMHYLLHRLETTREKHLEDARRYGHNVEQLAFYDPLTGLPNRRLLYQRARQSLSVAERKDWSLGLLYLDLNRFKSINDALGHDVGDELLCAVAQRLEQCVREGDILARLGGDEFAIFLYEACPDQTAQVARRIAEELNRSFRMGKHTLNVGVSIGIACYPEHGQTLPELLKSADAAMYAAKDQGLDFAFFDPDSNPYSPERLELENKLYSAVQNNHLTLHYQPVMNLRQGKLEGYEALVRWVQEEKEIPPGLFIPLAEEGSLIYSLDQRVLENGLQQLKQWASQGLHPILSLNISAQSLHRPGLRQQIEALLNKLKINPAQVMLEITETALISNPELSRQVLSDFQAMGLRIALDDFGSGYASLGYLRHLPINRLKIDRSLVRNIGQNAQDEQLLAAILELGRSLNLEVLAEGVETQAQLEWLVTHGFDYAQGFLLGRPLPAETIFDPPVLVR